MAWIMFWFLLLVFTVILGFFLYAAFWIKSDTSTKVTLGVLDSIVGFGMKPLVAFLFPSDSKDITRSNPESPKPGQ